jgi:hypothetical protein
MAFCTFGQGIMNTIELSIKYSKESIKTLCLLKIGNKVVEVIVKIEDNNSMKRGQQWEANWVPLIR